MDRDNPVLTIVVPCYNEYEVLPETAKQLTAVVRSLIAEALIAPASLILFVDDGSRDDSWRLIAEEAERNPHVSGLKLSRNFGHQSALLAGLHAAGRRSDCVVSIDADLQDDVNAIREFVLKFRDGCDIVYGIRKSRESDTWLKRSSAQWYYKLMRKVGINLIYNHADYRLLSKRAVTELQGFEERNLFLRGIVPLLGFRSGTVYYDRKERLAGESKYPLKKMLAFAWSGLTSFSLVPIRFVSMIGFVSFILSCLAGGYALVQNMLGRTTSGWTSIIISIWFIGGLLLMSVGLIGEYIGKIYGETKRRPAYIVETDLTDGK